MHALDREMMRVGAGEARDRHGGWGAKRKATAKQWGDMQHC